MDEEEMGPAPMISLGISGEELKTIGLEEQQYTTRKKGKSKALLEEDDQSKVGPIVLDMRLLDQNPHATTTSFTKRGRGRPPKAKTAEPNERGRGRKKKVDVGANSDIPKVKWKIVNEQKARKDDSDTEASGDQLGHEGSGGIPECRPGVWCSNKLELLSILPELCGKTCVNGISWTQSPVPVILLDGESGITISAMDGEKMTTEITITRDFECHTASMRGADGKPLSLPPTSDAIIATFLGSNVSASVFKPRWQKGRHTDPASRLSTKLSTTSTHPPIHIPNPGDSSLLSLEAAPFLPKDLSEVVMPAGDEVATRPTEPAALILPYGHSSIESSTIEPAVSLRKPTSSVAKKLEKVVKKKGRQGDTMKAKKLTIPPAPPEEGQSSLSVKEEHVSPSLTPVDGAPVHQVTSLPTPVSSRKRKAKKEPNNTITPRASKRLRHREPSVGPSQFNTKAKSEYSFRMNSTLKNHLAIDTSFGARLTGQSPPAVVPEPKPRPGPLMSPPLSPLTPLSPSPPPHIHSSGQCVPLPPHLRRSGRIAGKHDGEPAVKLEEETQFISSLPSNDVKSRQNKRKRSAFEASGSCLPTMPYGKVTAKRPTSVSNIRPKTEGRGKRPSSHPMKTRSAVISSDEMGLEKLIPFTVRLDGVAPPQAKSAIILKDLKFKKSKVEERASAIGTVGPQDQGDGTEVAKHNNRQLPLYEVESTPRPTWYEPRTPAGSFEIPGLVLPPSGLFSELPVEFPVVNRTPVCSSYSDQIDDDDELYGPAKEAQPQLNLDQDTLKFKATSITTQASAASEHQPVTSATCISIPGLTKTPPGLSSEFSEEASAAAVLPYSAHQDDDNEEIYTPPTRRRKVENPISTDLPIAAVYGGSDVDGNLGSCPISRPTSTGTGISGHNPLTGSHPVINGTREAQTPTTVHRPDVPLDTIIDSPPLSSEITSAVQKENAIIMSSNISQSGSVPCSLPDADRHAAGSTSMVTTIGRNAASEEFEHLKSVLDSSFPASAPEEIEVLNNALKDGTPVLPITTRDLFRRLSKCWLPEEFGYMYVGYWQVVGTQKTRLKASSRIKPGNSQSHLVTGRVQWSFKLQWLATGEDDLGHTNANLDVPWWIPCQPVISRSVRSTECFSLSRALEGSKDHFAATCNPLRSVISPSLLLPEPDDESSEGWSSNSGDGGSVRGWYCSDCGKLNRQTFWRRRKCGSSFCKDKSITSCPVRGLDVVRERGQQQPMVLPINTQPNFIDPLISDWNDGIKTITSRFSEHSRNSLGGATCTDAWAKHIFTGNLSHLQEDQTQLFEDMQRDVIFERQPLNTKPYFTYAAAVSSDAFDLAKSFGASSNSWDTAPSCMIDASDLLLHVSRCYGETEVDRVSGLVALAWSTNGRRKGNTYLAATHQTIVIMNLGCNTVIDLLPRSSSIISPSKTLPTPAPTPLKAEAQEEPSLNIISDWTQLIPLEPESDEQEDKSDLVIEPQHVDEVASTLVKAQERPRKTPKAEISKFTLLHGDSLILSGDDFEYTIQREGTSILLLGVLA